jgi:hypothetical protein
MRRLRHLSQWPAQRARDHRSERQSRAARGIRETHPGNAVGLEAERQCDSHQPAHCQRRRSHPLDAARAPGAFLSNGSGECWLDFSLRFFRHFKHGRVRGTDARRSGCVRAEAPGAEAGRARADFRGVRNKPLRRCLPFSSARVNGKRPIGAGPRVGLPFRRKCGLVADRR